MNKLAGLVVFYLALFFSARAQTLRPGFEKDEYISLMMVSAQFGDSAYAAALPPPQGYRFLYRSPVMGLDNCWELWLTDKGLPVISIRGTTKNEISWLGNFYAAMVPAKGELQLSATETFSYTLAQHNLAAVHIGWLIGTGFLAKDMLPKIDSLHRQGKNDFFIIGHSQGGAIAFLLTAYLRQLQKLQTLPAGIRFKTYCSAAPKPGNLYFAYEYEAMTVGGWSSNVVNTLDWVPQTPFSVQTIDDMAPINPFRGAKAFIKRNSWPKRWALWYAYGRLTKPANKARKNYQKYLGRYVEKSIRKALPGFAHPPYFNSSDYVRVGPTISLLPDEGYYAAFPQDEKQIFGNHLHGPYLHLIRQMGRSPALAGNENLSGTWELVSLSGSDVSTLYPQKKPFLTFDANASTLSGYTGCNNFSGNVQVNGSAIAFAENMALTKMFCAGGGEQAFLQALQKSQTYRLEGRALLLLQNGEVIMRFIKQ